MQGAVRRQAGGESSLFCSHLRLFTGPAFRGAAGRPGSCRSQPAHPTSFFPSVMPLTIPESQAAHNYVGTVVWGVTQSGPSRGLWHHGRRKPSYGLCEVRVVLGRGKDGEHGIVGASHLPSVSLSVIVRCSGLSLQWSPVHHSHHPLLLIRSISCTLLGIFICCFFL